MPAKLRELIEQGQRDIEHDERVPKWFYEYLHTGDGAMAAWRAGFCDDGADPWKVHMRLYSLYHEAVTEAVRYRQGMLEVMALANLEDAMRAGYESDDPKMKAVGERAAESVLDRGSLPKGAKIHGVLETPGNHEQQGDPRTALETLYEEFGYEALLANPKIRERPDYRAILDELRERDTVMIEREGQ